MFKLKFGIGNVIKHSTNLFFRTTMINQSPSRLADRSTDRTPSYRLTKE